MMDGSHYINFSPRDKQPKEGNGKEKGDRQENTELEISLIVSITNY